MPPKIQRLWRSIYSEPSVKAAVLGSVILFILGGMLMCYCPGWFVCGGALAMIGVVWAKGFRRWIAALMLVANIVMAVVHFRAQYAISEKIKRIRKVSVERQMTNQVHQLQ